MSIRIKERGEFEDFDCGFAGTASTGAKVTKLVPFACQLKGIIARVRTAGTTGTMNIDIQKNGTSVFSSGATAIQFASAATTPTYGAFAAANPAQFVKGDIITINITVVHTTPATDLAIAINLQRQRNTDNNGATETDTLGTEAE